MTISCDSVNTIDEDDFGEGNRCDFFFFPPLPAIFGGAPGCTIERMASDIDLSAGGVSDGTESIDEVGARVFEHVRRVADGEVLAKAEENGHREFQVWGERAISL